MDDRARHPGIAEERIRQPLFIVGLPRTGSTLLHHCWPRTRPAGWRRRGKSWRPRRPPSARATRRDPRIREAERQLRWLDVLAPDFKAIHPLGAQLALECIAIMGYAFLSPRFHTTYHVPTYQEWLERQDLRPAYEFHRRVLQHLQWRTPADRWVLKAPSHLWGFEALFATYPDALVVQTHRDPLTALASVASLTAVLQGAFTDELDLAEIGLEVTRRWATGLERAMQVRRSGILPAERFLDVNYDELVADPVGDDASPVCSLRPALRRGDRAANARAIWPTTPRTSTERTPTRWPPSGSIRASWRTGSRATASTSGFRPEGASPASAD